MESSQRHARRRLPPPACRPGRAGPRRSAPDDAQAIARLWWFGRLIGNTDMHLGNLAFRPVQGRLALAPAYDMLPMLHAPLPGGEVPVRAFDPPLPLPTQRAPWHAAWNAARDFWQAAAQDERIGAGFRAMCAEHGQQLAAAAVHA
ncbi:MAG: HipA domain-containing protein [Acidovorax sp.]